MPSAPPCPAGLVLVKLRFFTSSFSNSGLDSVLPKFQSREGFLLSSDQLKLCYGHIPLGSFELMPLLIILLVAGRGTI